MTGKTASTDFPTTGNALQPGPGGVDDAFVTYITGAGEDYDYVYSSYLGGSGEERGYGLAPVGAAGVCVAGYTYSSNFFTTPNAIQPAYGLNGDGFTTCLVKLGPAYAYLYFSYLGGSGGEVAFDMARDASTGAYVVGSTSSDNFPTTPFVPQRTRAGLVDAFATHIVEDGGVYRYDYSTFLGGTGNDSAYGLAVGGGGGIYLTGRTESTNFLTTTNAIQLARGGDWDGFVAWIVPGGTIRAYLPLVVRNQ